MSKNILYSVIGIIVLAVVAYGGYKVWHHYKAAMGGYAQTAATGTPASSSAQNSSGLPNKTNTSNGQLNQDLQNIQGSMNQLQKDQTTSIQDANNQSQDTPQQ